MARQGDFIADAAHEPRTPLAVIRASASHSLSREREAAAYQQKLASPRKAPLRIDLLLEEVAWSVRIIDLGSMRRYFPRCNRQFHLLASKDV
jgi:signal transduction histidine kinase